MRQLYVAIAVLTMIVVPFLLSGCGGGTKTYSPIATSTGSFTVAIINTPLGAPAKSRGSNVDQTVIYPNSASYTVTVTATGGFTGTVLLEEQGLPDGFAADFDVAAITLTGSTTSAQRTLTITPTVETVVDNTFHPFVVAGTSGSTSANSNTARIRVEGE